MNNELSELIETIPYGYTKYDFLLGKEKSIGNNGQNLTINILNFNRSEATIKLLDSIQKNLPNYAGKILIGDNGSTQAELKKLENYLKHFAKPIELIKFKQNYGVAKGRNELTKYVKTDWLMNIDNDIYFINNPLEIINNTIALLGVKFLNLPLLA